MAWGRFPFFSNHQTVFKTGPRHPPPLGIGCSSGEHSAAWFPWLEVFSPFRPGESKCPSNTPPLVPFSVGVDIGTGWLYFSVVFVFERNSFDQCGKKFLSPPFPRLLLPRLIFTLTSFGRLVCPCRLSSLLFTFFRQKPFPIFSWP